jgi:3-phenylpropionate/cinnamic acid dioxygenase small subunit
MTDRTTERLAAEFEIRNLVAKLAHLSDMDESLDEYLRCFTEDAVWEFPGEDREGLGPSTTVGLKAIEADRLERRADRFQGPGTNTRHVNTTLAVRVNSDATAAEAESYWMLIGDTKGQLQLRLIGHYLDRFVPTESGWKVAFRRITIG